MDNALTLKVAGILEDVPGNSDFPLGVVSSYEGFKKCSAYFYTTGWGNTMSNQQVYMLLPANVSADNSNKQLVQFSKKHYSEDKTSIRTNFLQPLSEIHFDNRFGKFR